MTRCAGWMVVAAWIVSGLAAQADPTTAWVEGIEGGDCLRLRDGARVRLQGISLPTPCVRSSDCVARLREFLRERVVGREVVLQRDGTPPADDDADHLALVFESPGRPSINAQLLERGLALFSCRSTVASSRDALLAAARRAQVQRRGLFASTPRGPVESLPFLNGAVLGLHHRDPAQAYDRELDELAELGFRHLTLIFSAFLDDVTAWRIDRHHPRSVRDDRLIATIRTARERHGMTVTLLPIVLLEHAGDDDWRGTIRPDPEERFWLEYDAFLSHYLDVAESTGVEMFSIGSEYGSLEDRTETWLRLIENARGRYTGLLTYSANWDHVHVPKFFDALDAVGMTAYFSLTEEDDPSRDRLVDAWRRVG
ncbi:MAG: thermonuclease family protein, partial [Planctomycetes bacterium]|nr:thermonuclease family protein [Planctomycetota bacterium]